jgi:uncharacterized membrane protein YphA (DoxX/SURF4 family)
MFGATMKKYPPIIAGIVLGALFVFASVVVLFNLVQGPPPPEGSAQAMFFGAIATTGYLTFIKIMELIGGILVAIPRTRNLDLLVLGPIIVNILAFHIFIASDQWFLNPMIILAVVLPLYLLWVERKRFAGLLVEQSSAAQ